MPRSATSFLLLLTLPMTAACGATAATASGWQDSMEQLYDNASVRPSEPPRRLWDRGEQERFLRRVGFADAVALGTARLVTVHTMLGAPRRIAVAFSPREVLHGELEPLTDEQGELMLPIRAGDNDFQLALRVIDHLAGSRYLLLLKRRPAPGGSHDLRWALYDPEPALLKEVHAMFRWLREHKDED